MQAAGALSDKINRVVEFVVAILMAALVLDVWIGVIDRYYFRWQLPWPEVFARYLMIWAALLAVSCGIARREHIGLTGFVMKLPARLRHAILIAIDLIALGLFVYLMWFGIPFAIGGLNRGAMIFGSNMAPFYSSIPVAAALASLQIVLVLLRDMGRHLDDADNQEVML